MNIKDICETGPTVYSPYPRRLESLNLQMKLERQHFLLSYFKVLIVDPAGIRTSDLPRDSPTLNQLNHRCAVKLGAQDTLLLDRLHYRYTNRVNSCQRREN